MEVAKSHVLTAFDYRAVGSRVLCKETDFMNALKWGIEQHDSSNDQKSGHHFIMLPSMVKRVSCGVGRRTENPEDYIPRLWRGKVELFLKREHALPTTGVAAVVYTRKAYRADPQVDAAQFAVTEGASHVLVAVLAFGGPEPQVSPTRFVTNLAGGNAAYAEMSVVDLALLAGKVDAYDAEYCVVAD